MAVSWLSLLQQDACVPSQVLPADTPSAILEKLLHMLVILRVSPQMHSLPFFVLLCAQEADPWGPLPVPPSFHDVREKLECLSPHSFRSILVLTVITPSLMSMTPVSGFPPMATALSGFWWHCPFPFALSLGMVQAPTVASPWWLSLLLLPFILSTPLHVVTSLESSPFSI